MTERRERVETSDVRAAWDRAADAYVAGQESGRDYYRLEFFGPAQVALCGDVTGLRVLDVGCGSGYLARELARRGARVTAVDLSPRMIEHARRLERAEPLDIELAVADAETIDGTYGAASFDLVTSCLALQDMAHPDRALRAMHTVLRAGGRAVLSISHPCTDTPYREWDKDDAGRKRALRIDRYFDRDVVTYHWRGWSYDFTTPAVHATLEEWVAWMFDAGFTLRAFREPRPTDDAVRARPDLEDAARVPYYAMFVLERTA
jgi:ubiquinone/menaquinone biosynthesis C-methylase UbiE